VLSNFTDLAPWVPGLAGPMVEQNPDHAVSQALSEVSHLSAFSQSNASKAFSALSGTHSSKALTGVLSQIGTPRDTLGQRSQGSTWDRNRPPRPEADRSLKGSRSYKERQSEDHIDESFATSTLAATSTTMLSCLSDSDEDTAELVSTVSLPGTTSTTFPEAGRSVSSMSGPTAPSALRRPRQNSKAVEALPSSRSLTSGAPSSSSVSPTNSTATDPRKPGRRRRREHEEQTLETHAKEERSKGEDNDLLKMLEKKGTFRFASSGQATPRVESTAKRMESPSACRSSEPLDALDLELQKPAAQSLRLSADWARSPSGSSRNRAGSACDSSRVATPGSGTGDFGSRASTPRQRSSRALKGTGRAICGSLTSRQLEP